MPDAPRPGTPQAARSRADNDTGYDFRTQVVEPGQPFHPLSAKQKMVFLFHEQFSPQALVPAFISAGYDQLTDDDPRYGVDSGAFGARLGADALRQATMRFFSDGLMPIVLHEDPRYYRKATGSYVDRGVYAAERVFINRHDSGKNGFNYANVTGELLASALTTAYYPDPSLGANVVMETWATSLAGGALNNEFREFLPDAFRAWHHYRRRRSAARSRTP